MKSQKGQIHMDGCVRLETRRLLGVLRTVWGAVRELVEMHFSRYLAMKQEREKRQEFSNFILLKIIVDS